MKSKSIRIVVLAVIGFLSLWGCEEFVRRKIGGFAGSYPFVEYWEINASEQEVITAIRELVKSNPGYRPPDSTEHISTRDSSIENDYWLHIVLYYPDTREVVQSWTRPDADTSVTTFAFVGLRSIDIPSEMRLINRDFWFLANRQQIRKFKTTFVDRIIHQIDKCRVR